MSHASVIVAVDGQAAGSVIQKKVEWEMAPFDENGKWFRKGSRWDWYVIGGRFDGRFLGQNIARVEDLPREKLLPAQEKRFVDWWKQGVDAYKESPDRAKWIFDFAGETKEEWLDKHLGRERERWFPTACAFLYGRRWNEGERMGWFGGTTKTECEIEGQAPRVCKTSDRKTGAQVLTWNEPYEKWQVKFYERFIKGLSPETWLVFVDYHV